MPRARRSVPYSTALVVGPLLLAAMAASPGCAHRTPPAPQGPSKSVQSEAARITTVAYEDDFTEGRLIFQALPANAPERSALRGKLLHYLLDPVLALNKTTLRREVRDLESDDIYDIVYESFRDALSLYDPAEIWAQPPRITAEEKALLIPAAQLVVAVFSPRGADQQVTLALAALATLAPEAREWQDRLDQVVRWTDEASAYSERGIRRNTSALDMLRS